MKDDHRSYIRCDYNCDDHPTFNSSGQMSGQEVNGINDLNL